MKVSFDPLRRFRPMLRSSLRKQSCCAKQSEHDRVIDDESEQSEWSSFHFLEIASSRSLLLVTRFTRILRWKRKRRSGINALSGNRW